MSPRVAAGLAAPAAARSSRGAGSLGLALAGLLAALGPAPDAGADRGEEERGHHERRHHDGEGGERRSRGARRERPAPAPLRDGPASPAGPGLSATEGAAFYKTECGSCHLAYPPGLLPAASWVALVGGLEHHFGQNAELEPQAALRLQAWLAVNGAEAGTHARSAKLLRSLDEPAPLRLSETPYLRSKHHELRPDVFAREAVKSRANCPACHQGAEAGDFREDRVKIPRGP